MKTDDLKRRLESSGIKIAAEATGEDVKAIALDEWDLGASSPARSRMRKRRPTADEIAAKVTMPVALREAVIRISRREDRSFSATVRRALEIYIAKAGGPLAD